MDDVYFKLRYKYSNMVLIIKHNEYYRIYGNDAVMCNVIFNYKVNYGVVGFPLKSLEKVITEFKNRSVSVVIYDSEDSIIENTVKNNKYVELSNELLKEYVRILNIKEEINRLEKIIISDNSLEELRNFVNVLASKA